MADRNQKENRRKQGVDVLNQARGMEMQATGQYMIQHYQLEAMDYGKLASKLKKTAIDDEQAHLTDFQNIGDPIRRLGDMYLARLAGT